MGSPTLSVSDLQSHIVTFGLDVHPPIELSNERIRLSLFFEEARTKWSDSYEEVTAGETKYSISKLFRKDQQTQGPAVPIETFVLTPRGPVFRFPLRLPDPVGDTGLHKEYRSRFDAVREMLWSVVPGHTILRVGLIRDLVFASGETDFACLMSKRAEWCGARLVGGSRVFHYQDDLCNIQFAVKPVRISKTTQLPVGARIEEPAGLGLQARLDVNNAKIGPMQDADIDQVIDRAVGFWPDGVLEYLQGITT